MTIKKMTRWKWKYKPHETHKMGERFTDILSPAGTPRFYTIRKCTKCGYMQFEHAAGKFIDSELQKPCTK